MKYKKGQIIPRFLARCQNRKTQHRNVFGCDVEISGKTITALSGGAVFVIKGAYIGGKRGRPKIYNRVDFAGARLLNAEIGVYVETAGFPAIV
jgi:hypothetical protein